MLTGAEGVSEERGRPWDGSRPVERLPEKYPSASR